MRPPFLDDLSATQAGRRTRRRSGRARRARAGRRASVIGHEMSRRYVLEYPVDDPDEDEDDDGDEDSEDGDDEDADEEDPETWQVSCSTAFP